MDRSLRWRSIGLVAILVFAVLSLLPSVVGKKALPSWYNQFFDRSMQLGLDLQGGLHIVYSIDLDKAVDDKASEIMRDFEAKLDELQIQGTLEPEVRTRGIYEVVLYGSDIRLSGRFPQPDPLALGVPAASLRPADAFVAGFDRDDGQEITGLAISPDGRHLGTILTGQATSNATFGDDGSTLYLTADMDIIRVRTSTRGLGF